MYVFQYEINKKRSERSIWMIEYLLFYIGYVIMLSSEGLNSYMLVYIYVLFCTYEEI